MKKQILILVVFVLAAFVGSKSSYGQACTPDPLKPAAGVAYEYAVTISGTTGGTSPVFDWYVTKSTNLMTPTIIAPGTDFTVNSGAGLSTYNTSGATTNRISLTWTSLSVASTDPYYLVMKYSEVSSTGSCTVMNMKVYMIDPVNTFLLAVAGSDAAGIVANNMTCPDDIAGATIIPGATPTVTFDYGTNSIYYKVTASGAIGTWTPSIELPPLAGGGQNYKSASWDLVGGTTPKTFGLVDGDLDGGTFTSTDTSAPVSVAGSDIIITIVIDNVKWEHLNFQDIQIGVDGVLPGNVKDIVSATDCSDAADFDKKGTFRINARPNVADATTDTPNPTDFIIPTP